MNNVIKGAAVVVGLAIAVYIVLRVVPTAGGGGPDRCELLAKQQTATVDVAATVKGLDLVKAKIGVTAGQVQEVDQILKDYAFKYTSVCRDNDAKKIADAEYNCRRDNMERVLGATRSLALTLDAMKSIADPASQQDIVLKDIDLIKDLAQADFSKGCGSALAVSTSSLTFEGPTPERTIEVANGGNRDLTYTVTDLPEAFAAVQLSGTIPVGHSAVVVAIKRAPFPVMVNTPVVFYVKDNFNNKIAVKIVVDANNAQLYQRLAAETVKGMPAGHATPTLEDAVASVAKTFPEMKDAGTRYFLAAGALKEIGNFAEADRALKALSTQNASLYHAPATQLLAGIVSFQRNEGTLALDHFFKAGSTPGADEGARTASKLASGALWLSNGNPAAAEKFLADPDVRNRVVVDSNFSNYVASEFKLPGLTKAVMAAKPVTVF
jgi:hypothetical protein